MMGIPNSLQYAGNVSPHITKALVAAHNAAAIEPQAQQTGLSKDLPLPAPTKPLADVFFTAIQASGAYYPYR